MKRILLVGLMLLSVTSAFAQSDKPLSKMDTKDFITQVKELVSVGDIETAIDVYLEKVRSEGAHV